MCQIKQQMRKQGKDNKKFHFSTWVKIFMQRHDKSGGKREGR